MDQSYYKYFFSTRHLAAGILLFVLGIAGVSCQNTADTDTLEPSDWKLGVQAWTFHKTTFAEALDKIDSTGAKYIEGFPGQEIGSDIDGKLDYRTMDGDKKEAVKELLEEHDLEMVSYGVVVPETEDDWKQLFEFADVMGLDNIAAEPKEDHLSLISDLADEYGINVAIHNHPNPSHYWDPDILLSAIEGQSSRIGAAADVGHWQRSGLDPVESMKKLDGHIKEFHMKDLNKKNDESAHDVPWGTGVNDIEGIMKEMKRQNFKGYVFVEYEYNWGENVPDVKKSIEYFRKKKQELLGDED